jgi:hypothetical protein
MKKIQDLDINKITYCPSKKIYIKYDKDPLIVTLPELEIYGIYECNNKYCSHELYLKLDKTTAEMFNKIDNKIITDYNSWPDKKENIQYKMFVRESDNGEFIKLKVLKNKTAIYENAKRSKLNRLDYTKAKALIEIESVLVKDNTCCLHVRLLQFAVTNDNIKKEVELNLSDSS